jgi:hypothetical protein
MAKERVRTIQTGVKEKGKKTLRVRLHKDELETLNNLRSLHNEAIALGQDPRDVKQGWVKSKEVSLFVKNPNFEGQQDAQIEFKDKLIESLKEHSPNYSKIKRNKSKEGHLLVIDPADVHVGKLCSAFEVGTEYNSQIAVQRVLEGVDGILNKSNGFNIDKINIILGNDILHVDNPRNSTTSLTNQDVSGMWYDNFLMAKDLYVDVIDKLINIADVHVTFNPSNHDYMSGFMLAEVIQTHFRKCKNITFDCSINHRKYFTYGNSLIGTTHGDGAKQIDLGSLMSVEAKEHWANSEHRYFYTHHIHHKTSKEMINVMIESLRSPSPADSWHHRNGYINNPAIEGFIHHKENGQIARLTHYF